jgi:hypothetical protein
MARKKNTFNRAEKIRSRRDKKSRKPVKSSRGNRNTLGRQMPPVMVRGRSQNQVRSRKKGLRSKTLKRRYDIALATPGVEIRLPSIPVVHFSWRILSFMLTVGLTFLIYYLWTSPQFQVQIVEMNGVLRLSVDELSRTLNLYNKPVFMLEPEELEKSLSLAYPEIKDLSIRIGLPASVVVDVVERVPLIAWHQNSSIQWIDGDGYAFSPRGDAEKLVPVHASAPPPKPAQDLVDGEPKELGFGYQAFMQPELVTGILVMRASTPEEAGLVYDSQHGLGWKDSRGWDVFFGIKGDDIPSKIVVYKSIAKQLQADGITPVLINVEHIHAPYYRLEQ